MTRCSRSVSHGLEVGGCVLLAGHAGRCVGAAGADRATMVAAVEARSRKLVAEIKRMPLAERIRLAADLLEKGGVDHAEKLTEHCLGEIRKLLPGGDRFLPHPVVCSAPGRCGYTGSGEFTCSKCRRACCWCVDKACSKLCDDCVLGGDS